MRKNMMFSKKMNFDFVTCVAPFPFLKILLPLSILRSK